MATTPQAHEGKPQDEYLHVKKQRNVQISSTSTPPENEGPSQDTQLEDERFHQTRSTMITTPLTSLSIEAATSPASVDDASLHPPGAEDTSQDQHDPFGSTSPSALPSKAVETDQRD